jgi:hypothetical protein
MEYIGFLLSLAQAQLSITSDKRSKIMNFLTELIGQVQSGSWDVALADTTIGKLAAIAMVYVVPGGRAAYATRYKARTVTAAIWPDPFGKPPHGPGLEQVWQSLLIRQVRSGSWDVSVWQTPQWTDTKDLGVPLPLIRGCTWHAGREVYVPVAVQLTHFLPEMF